MRYLLCAWLMLGVAVAESVATKEQSLSEIKASLLVPDGWFLKTESEEGVTVYQLTREKAESSGDLFAAGLILSVTTKVPDRASMKPSQYAAELLSSAQEDGATAKLERFAEGPLQCFRVEYVIESEQGNVLIVNLAKANDGSGTLYFATWQSPVAEEAKLKEVREKVLASLKVDPAF